ncbi:hypothetical protein ABT160_07975 [Streptomyces sp. NPDC001941]|uniref:hypothetical protein n=1 Tax=Streptomyces sp. NPDC001941 TaxID=3154659 RepID=UPI0033183319
MAKQHVTVCLAPCEPADLLRAIGEAMAPFDMNQDDIDLAERHGRWDYWYVSGVGREFAVRPGHEHDPGLVRTEDWLDGMGLVPWTEDDAERAPDRHCYGGPKELLDLGREREEAAARAEREWRAWHELAAAHPAPLPFSTFSARTERDPDAYPWDRAVADYDAQPLRAALEAHPDVDSFGDDPYATFGADLDAYVERRVIRVLPTAALLTLDGRWAEGAGDDYYRWATHYLDALPPSSMIVRVHHHQ